MMNVSVHYNPYYEKIIKQIAGSKTMDILLYPIANYLASIEQKKYKVKPRMFNCVSIETHTQCNNRCSFCPHSSKERKRTEGVMSDEIFKIIINQLSDLNYSDIVLFSLNNEPLMDERLADFIEYTRERLPNCRISFRTNGILLDIEKLNNFFKAGLDVITINNYATGNKPIPSVENIMMNLDRLRLTKEQKVVIVFREKSEHLFNRGGNVKNKRRLIERKRFCYYPFVMINVVYNGDVNLCCQDFYCDEIMGNIQSSHILDIWNGDKFTYVRKNLLDKNRSFSKLCKYCDFTGFHFTMTKYKRLNLLIRAFLM